MVFKRTSISIIDYGYGNHGSLINTLKKTGHNIRVIFDPNDSHQSEILIIPGVGCFPQGMDELAKRGFVEFLIEKKNLGIPIIGICLGMQFLSSKSYEVKETNGLGFIDGEIVKLVNIKTHIGWNEITFKNQKYELAELFEKESFYFNHLYQYVGPEKYKVASTNDRNSIPAIIKKENIFGIQFHPEKSQGAGVEFFKNLLLKL